MKKYDEALEYLTLSLKLLESLKKQPQQPNTQEISQQALSKELAKSQKLLADVFYNQRVFNKAEEFGKKALALIQEIYGIHHVNSIDYLNFLGLLYLSMGKNEASLINFNKAYEISIDFLGKDSSKTVPIMLNLGVLYNVMGKDEDAEKILSKCEEICITNKMNPELANTYYNLGNLFAKMKNVEKARDYYKKSLEIYENLKIEIEKLAFIHYNLGVMAISLKEIEPAKLHFKASLDKYQTFLGKQEYANHTNVKKMTEFIKKLK
jgi:tetratricopeptide (TPR) repeat protein